MGGEPGLFARAHALILSRDFLLADSTCVEDSSPPLMRRLPTSR